MEEEDEGSEGSVVIFHNFSAVSDGERNRGADENLTVGGLKT